MTSILNKGTPLNEITDMWVLYKIIDVIKRKYGEKHPTIKKARKRIQELEERA